MDNFHVYRDGEYDRKANLKIKLDAKIELFKRATANKMQEVDYYFVHHQKMIR